MSLLNFFISASNQVVQKPLLSLTDLVIVFDGNSLIKCTYINAAPVDQYWPKLVQTWLSTRAKSLEFYSYGVDNKTLSTMITEAPSIVDVNIDSNKTNLCVVWEDANDIITNNKTGAQNFANMQTYVSARYTAGFDYVIVIGGYYPRTPYNVGVTTLDLDNQYDYFGLLSSSSLGDERIDLRNAPYIGGARSQAQDLTYYNDYLHLTNQGYDEIATMVIYKGILKIFDI